MKASNDKINPTAKDHTYVAQKEKHQLKNMQEKYEDIHFIDSTKPVWNYSLFSEEDVTNFQNGTHYRLYELFGNKQLEVLNIAGTYFAVWAPNATQVSVIGNFNDWDNEKHVLYVRMENSGIWEGFIPGVLSGES